VITDQHHHTAQADGTEGKDLNPSALHDQEQLGDGSYPLRKYSPTSRGRHTKEGRGSRGRTKEEGYGRSPAPPRNNELYSIYRL